MGATRPRILFVTRSYPPMRGGGPFVRKQQVEFLRARGYEVDVFAPEAVSAAGDPGPGVHILPGPPLRLGNVLHRLHLACDDLDPWARKTARELAARARPGDVVFLTSGGELSTPRIGHYLRREGFRGGILVNLHDFPDGAVYEGSKDMGRSFPRYERWEEEAYSACDLVLANSRVMRDMIKAKYPALAEKVDYFWFGYDAASQPLRSRTRSAGDPLTIGYIGTMTMLQGPHILLEAWRGLGAEERARIRLLFVGDVSGNPMLAQADDIEKIGYMDRHELIRLMGERMDMAFVSVINRRIFRPLMSTKFYENVGMGLPILGALPEDCEAGRVLAEYGFGWVCTYGDIPALQALLRGFIADPGRLDRARDALLEKRPEFAAERTMMRMVEAIQRIAKASR